MTASHPPGSSYSAKISLLKIIINNKLNIFFQDNTSAEESHQDSPHDSFQDSPQDNLQDSLQDSLQDDLQDSLLSDLDLEKIHLDDRKANIDTSTGFGAEDIQFKPLAEQLLSKLRFAKRT